MKNVAVFAAGFVAGLVTLFILVLIFGDYDESAPQVVAEVAPAAQSEPLPAVPTDTPQATTTPIPTDTPTVTSVLPAPTPLPTWTPVPPGLNTDVIVGGVRWRALAVEEVGNTLHSDNQFADDLSTQGKYVRVTMEIENRQGAPLYYVSPHLMDSQGRRYNPLDMAGLYVPEQLNCTIVDFNPGLTLQCADLFEVAADAGGYSLIVNNFEMFDAIESIIALR